MTACPGYDCTSRDRCWRFTGPFVPQQSVFYSDPRMAGGACALFLSDSAFRHLEGETSDV